MSDKVVSFERAHRRPDPARVQEFAETARRLQRERQESADVVTRVLRETPREEWPRLATRPELRNSGALNRLEAEVSSRLEKEPQEALLLSDLAASIAETLPPDSYPAVVLAQLRAHAWKDRAQALCYISRYDEALEAADRAEQQIATFGTLAHDRAVVRYTRAIILQKIGRFEESRALLAECTAVFRDYGDTRLQLFCGISEGTLLYRSGAFQSAYDVFVSLFDVAIAAGDLESGARIRNNAGHCAVELGDFAAANIHLSRAVSQFIDLGKPVEAIRTDMSYGALLIRRGATLMGMQRLRDARRSFLMHGLFEDAGICGLEIAEALLAGGSASEAADLAAEIAVQFMQTGVNDRAVAALAYLQSMLASSAASPKTVRYVRDFLEKLRSNPALEFAAR
jgi:tetratricopeptide (TPR) repeat protein